MNKQTIIFDLDDTLIHCNKYFLEAIEVFAEKIKCWFSSCNLEIKEIKEKQQEIDIKGVSKHGFAAEHFAMSLLETYAYFSESLDRVRVSEEEEMLKDIAASAYNQSFEPYPSMREVLEFLYKQGHELYLYTAGSPKTQKRKVEIVGIGQYFGDRIFVTPRKNSEVLQSIIDKHNLDKESTWMIGNSMKSDIMPAVQVGIKAVYIPGLFEWAYDNVNLKDSEKQYFITLKALKEVSELFLEEQAI